MKFTTVVQREAADRYDRLDDIELIRLLKAGDEGAFTALYNKYAQYLADVLYRYVKSEELMENALQNVFMKLWEDRATLNLSSNVKGYLYASMKNNVLNTIKRNLNGVRKAYEVAQADIADPVTVEIERREDRELIEQEIASLKPAMQEIISYKREGLTNEEISKKIGMPITTVAVYYSRALKELKKRFNKSNILLQLLIVFLMW